MFLDQKAEREAKEAALEKAAKDAVAQAEADKKKAEEIAAASASAAAAAREDVEKEYKAAAAAAEAAAAEDAAAAKAAKPAKEPDKPIKFKDAIGRRFSFPFDLCKEWRVSLLTGLKMLFSAYLTNMVIGHGIFDQRSVSPC